MSRIEVSAGNHGIFGYPVVWVEPTVAEAVFIIVRHDEMEIGLATDEYVLEMIGEAWAEGEPAEDRWDVLLVKTAKMPYPMPCKVERTEEPGGTTAVFRTADRIARFAAKV
jgi:hypothetical protein